MDPASSSPSNYTSPISTTPHHDLSEQMAPSSSSPYGRSVSPLSSTAGPAHAVAEQMDDVAVPVLLSASATAEPLPESAPVAPHSVKDITQDCKKKAAELESMTPEQLKEAKLLQAAKERAIVAGILASASGGAVLLGAVVTIAFPPAGIAMAAVGLVFAVGAVEAMKPPDEKEDKDKVKEAHEHHKPKENEEPERKRRKEDDPFSIEMTELPARPEVRDPDEPPTSGKKGR